MTTVVDLNDTQLVLLTNACQREAGNMLPLPASLSDGGPRITKAIAGLLRLELAREAETRVADQVWRQDGETRIGLLITEAGRIAIGIEPLEQSGSQQIGPACEPPLSGSDRPLGDPSAFRAGSKQALVVSMLSSDNGASIDDLVKATIWLPHTTRAAITGLRKRGYAVLTEKRDGVSIYRLATISA